MILIMMQLVGSGDPTTLSYWFNWKVFLCAIWVLAPSSIAAFLIWKYEISNGRGRKQVDDASWKPCLKEIHPIFLMLFRILAFGLLLVSLSFDVAIHGVDLFMYYTQWTFTLVTIYFGLGSLLSLRGCLHHVKITKSNKPHSPGDMEHGLYMPLAHGVNENGFKLSESDSPEKSHAPLTFGFWDYLFQVLYQMTAGAVTITDVVYWLVIFPFMTLRDYEMNFLTVVTHSVNAILLLGDTVLNRMQFPWFGISYFVLCTGIYVIFQWIIHAVVPLWWPYPFLDLSQARAPLWYLVVAVMHVPCYYIYLLVVKVKHFMLSRWFPHSYMS